MTAAATSDFLPRQNGMTDLDWLQLVLSGREVTRITQHLALVIFMIADLKGGATRSVRDLEAITGWSRETIADHLSELEIFIKVTLGRGRAKTQYQLEAAITEVLRRSENGGFVPYVASSKPHATEDDEDYWTDLAVDLPDAASAVCTAVAVPPAALRPGMADELDAISDATEVSAPATATPDTKIDANIEAGKADAKIDANPDANLAVKEPDANSDFVASQPDAKAEKSPRVYARATKESPSEILIVSKDSPLPPKVQAENNQGEGEEVDLVQVNCVKITGPNFTIDLKAIDMAASLVGMPLERGRMIAEMYAREWAANNNKPNHVMAYLKKMIAGDRNDAAIAEVKLQKANAGGGTVTHQKQEEAKNQMIDAFRARRAAKQQEKPQ